MCSGSEVVNHHAAQCRNSLLSKGKSPNSEFIVMSQYLRRAAKIKARAIVQIRALAQTCAHFTLPVVATDRKKSQAPTVIFLVCPNFTDTWDILATVFQRYLKKMDNSKMRKSTGKERYPGKALS